MNLFFYNYDGDTWDSELWIIRALNQISGYNTECNVLDYTVQEVRNRALINIHV